MRAEILSVGNELLSGAVVDTNSAWMASRLYEEGVLVQAMATLPDALGPLAAALRASAQRCDLLLVSGGLGPTEDDLTAEAAAEAAGVPMERSREAEALVAEAIAARGLASSERQLGQADLPRGAVVLPNEEGTAPGFSLTIGACTAFFFPGPPRELWPLFDREVPAHLERSVDAGEAIATLTLRTFGRSESRLADLVREITLPEGIEVGFQVLFPEIHLRLLARASDASGARDRVEAAARALENGLGDLVFARGETSFPAFLLGSLRARGLRLALAESCTGGLAGALLTDVPGASATLTLSAVTYANEAKTAVLGVSPETLATAGAVSEACAREMARGARRAGAADLAVAITGVAGPGGGSEEKPVGTVCLAVDGPGQHRRACTLRLFGDRARVRRAAAFAAFELARQAIGAGEGRRL